MFQVIHVSHTGPNALGNVIFSVCDIIPYKSAILNILTINSSFLPLFLQKKTGHSCILAAIIFNFARKQKPEKQSGTLFLRAI